MGWHDCNERNQFGEDVVVAVFQLEVDEDELGVFVVAEEG